jgi:hypothetical protein
VLRPSGRFAASVPLSSRNEPVWALLDSAIDRWLPPAPKADDLSETVRNARALRDAALEAGFATARVEVVEEEIRWESAEQMVTSFMAWVDYAARLEGIDGVRRQAIRDDAVTTLQRDFPGAIQTRGRNHVLFADR